MRVVRRHGFVFAVRRVQAARGYHHFVARDEGRGHANRGFERAARVIAQIEHEAFELTLAVHFFEFADEIFECRLLELRDANPCVARLNHFGFDRLGFDHCAGEGFQNRFALTGAHDGDAYFRAFLTAQTRDRFGQSAHFAHGLAINRNDQITRKDACFERRTVFNRCHDHDAAAFARLNLHADAGEFTGNAFFQLFEVFFVKV